MTKRKQSEQSEAAQLIEQIKETWGYTQTTLAEQLGRSEKMIRKIVRGEVPGGKYLPALREMFDNGHPEHQPPRPRNKAGKLVRVRGKRGGASVLPPDPPGRYVDLPKRGKAVSAVEVLGPGSRRSTYMAPKTKRAKGRAAINEKIKSDLRSEARGQARGRKRIKFEAITSKGRRVEVGAKGGYSVSAALAAVNDADDPLEWMSSQIANRYAATSGGVVIVGWTMTSYYAGTASKP